MDAAPVTSARTPTGWRVRDDAALTARARAEGWWHDRTLADALAEAAAATPDRVVLIDGDTRLTAAVLAAEARQLAAAMLSRFAPGSVVSFMLPNWHEAATIYVAATLAGMVAHPILPSLRDRDLSFMLDDAGSRMIFIPAGFRGHDCSAMLARIAPALASPPDVVVVRGAAGPHTGYAALLDGPGDAALPPLDAGDVRMVMYTSGTTGRPKGVLHTHRSLGALITQIGAHWLVAPGDRFLVPSPISHIGGSIYAFEAPLLLGTAAVLMESWDPAAAVALIEREGCTHMAGATPFLVQLLAAARAAGTRLPSLKLFVCGGASVPPALIREAGDWFENAAVTRVYGSTEVPVTTVGVVERGAAAAADTDGRAGLAEIAIAADGEVRARGPQMLAGYLHAEDEAGAFDERGFYRTGDQGRVDASGHLVITGRIKDLIIRNGENIAPKEIEDLLAAHPAVGEVAIVGVPDARTGERAIAVVVPRGDERIDVAAIGAYLTALGVARFKHPEGVVHRAALPRNDAGKVLKEALRRAVLQPVDRGD